MHELIKYQFNTRRKKYGTGAALSLLNGNVGHEVLAFHKKLPNYAVTPLHNLAHLSRRLGLGSIHIKDESWRFGLNAFKGLGGSYAVGKYLADKLQCDINSLSFAALNTPEIKEKLRIVFLLPRRMAIMAVVWRGRRSN